MLRQYCQGACHLSMSFSSHALNILCAVAISVCNDYMYYHVINVYS